MSKSKKEGSRNFYGEYSLEQWINFVLTKEIILPDYQRAFVWEKEDVEDLIDSLKNGLFVPPITIGNYGGKTNYILDGQQRLSAILIAYIGLFPDRDKFKFKDKEYLSTANENDDLDDDEDRMPIDWQFNCFTTEGQDKESILNKIDRSKYDPVDYELDENFWKDTYIGFSLIIPISDKKPEQQKLYSSVFRNINIKGKSFSLANKILAFISILDIGPIPSIEALSSFFNFNPFFTTSVNVILLIIFSSYLYFIYILYQYLYFYYIKSISHFFTKSISFCKKNTKTCHDRKNCLKIT